MRVILALLASIFLIISSLHFSQGKDSESSDLRAVHKLGKKEVLSLPFPQLAEFVWNRYYRGLVGEFHYFGANPTKLSEQDLSKPATILIHGSESNQGQWYDFLKAYHEKGDLGAIFTFNYQDGNELEALKQKIQEIQKLYKAFGKSEISINLVGHSLGGIVAAEYAFSKENWVKETKVNKVITIASRLKNIKQPLQTPFYRYCKDIILRIDDLFSKIEKNSDHVKLYTIAAEKDWLVPKESALIAKESSHRATVPGAGHVAVSQSEVTTNQVIEWLVS
jgi:pimeloyl-ACP methyl ester carboxylesterase